MLWSLCTSLQTHTGDRRTMELFPILVGLVALMVSTEGSVGPSTNTSFCSESKECLEYELICQTDEYEVRHYSPTRWISTDAEAYFMGVGAAMAFRRLFQYITGANDAGIQMEMTAPVLVKIPEETKMWEPAIYTLNFPLPAAYQDKPPTPTNDKLYFTEMPDMDVYVRSYGGWMLSVTSRLHAHLLTKELDRVKALYNHTYHYGVGYDSPLKLLNRHNEVWYVSEGEPVCTDPQEPTPVHTPTPAPTQTLSHSPTDTPANFPAHTLSDSPNLTTSNTPTGSSSPTPSDVPSQPPSYMPPLSPSDLPSSAPSHLPSEAPFSNSSTSAPSSADSPSNSTDPLSVNPALDPQADVGLSNNTAHGSLETQADEQSEVQLADAH